MEQINIVFQRITYCLGPTFFSVGLSLLAADRGSKYFEAGNWEGADDDMLWGTLNG